MVDNLTFDDGEPLTNVKLQSLYNAIKQLEGDVAKTSLINSMDNTKYTPIIYANSILVSTGMPATGSPTKYQITYTGFQSSNVYIVATLNGIGLGTSGSVTYSILDKGPSSANIQILHFDKGLVGKPFKIDYIVVEMKQSQA